MKYGDFNFLIDKDFEDEFEKVKKLYEKNGNIERLNERLENRYKIMFDDFD
jgi:hypothetical protein